jgi:L-threonylcarbamoyladenylate synthase
MIVDRAAEILLRGGVIAYPTESVFGLGCLPDRPEAVARILAIKCRDSAKGLILIASTEAQLDGWIALPNSTALPAVDRTIPITWVVPATARVSALVRGNNSGVAVRLTSNPLARSICDATGSPLVSTSANISGRPIARNRYILRRQFGTLVDYLVPGDCGPASGPSEIRNLLTGNVIRPRPS